MTTSLRSLVETTAPRSLAEPNAFAALAVAQSGLMTREQLRGFEVTWHAADRRIRRGQWQPVTPRVVALTTGRLDGQQRYWAAVLHAGGGAVLAGASAAAFRGLRRYEEETIHVLVPPGRRVPTVSDTRATAVLAAAVQQRLTTADRLIGTVVGLGRMPRRRPVLEVLADVAGGSHSLPEREAYLMCRRYGIPLPERKAIRLDAAGRRRWLDLFWPRWRFAVEIDGAFHTEWSRGRRTSSG